MWGTTGVVAKAAYSLDVSPLLLAAARVNVTWIALGAYLLAAARPLLHVHRRDVPHLAIFGIIGIGLTQFTYLFTMTQASVGVAVLLQSLSPALIYLYSLLTRAESVRRAKLAALLLAFAGGAAVVMGQGGWGSTVTALGLVSGVTSAVCWAFYALRAKPWLDTYSQWTLVFWGSGFASLAWWALLPPGQIMRALIDTPTLLAVVLYLAIFCTVIPSGLYLHGIRLLMPSTAGILGSFEPVAASVFAYALLGETLSALQLIGGGLVIAALITLQAGTAGECD